jgi:hypothetical protein
MMDDKYGVSLQLLVNPFVRAHPSLEPGSKDFLAALLKAANAISPDGDAVKIYSEHFEYLETRHNDVLPHTFAEEADDPWFCFPKLTNTGLNLWRRDIALEPTTLDSLIIRGNTCIDLEGHVPDCGKLDGKYIETEQRKLIAEYVGSLTAYFPWGDTTCMFRGRIRFLWLQLPLDDGLNIADKYYFVWNRCSTRNVRDGCGAEHLVHEMVFDFYRKLPDHTGISVEKAMLTPSSMSEPTIEMKVIMAEIPSSAPPNPGKRKRGIDIDLTKDSPISDEKSPPMKRVKVDEPPKSSSSSKQQLFDVQYEPEIICQICHEVPPTTTVSCGHTVLCGDCSRKLAKDENPHTTKCVICDQLINFIYYNDVDMVVIPGQAPPIEKDGRMDELPVAPSSTSTSITSSSANSSKSQMERDFDLIQAGQMSLIAFKDKYNLKYI